MQWLWLICGILGGAAMAGSLVAWLMAARRRTVQDELVTARTRNQMLDEELSRQSSETETVRRQLAEAGTAREHAQREKSVLAEQLKAREQQFAEQKELLDHARTQLCDAFSSLGSKALRENNEQFINMASKTFETMMTKAKGDVEKKHQAIDHLVKPIRELLEKQNSAVGEIEKKREVAYTRLEQQIKSIMTSHEKLGSETSRLVTALRRPEQRGRWGEMQLRNACELGGMTRHCDFAEQLATDDPNSRDRPDMTIKLPGGGKIVVDSKVALDAYLDALEPECDRAALLKRHAGQVEGHYKRLASKRYWEQYDRTPKLVVMFIPLESALVAALDHKPDLHADAMENHVLIATPTLLVALLRSVAYGWQQEALAVNAREISNVGQELYKRLSVFVEHFEKIGVNLERSTRAYNAAVGSLERNVLSSTRKLKDLHVTAEQECEPPESIDHDVRMISAEELRSSNGQAEAEGS